MIYPVDDSYVCEKTQITDQQQIFEKQRGQLVISKDSEPLSSHGVKEWSNRILKKRNTTVDWPETTSERSKQTYIIIRIYRLNKQFNSLTVCFFNIYIYIFFEY